MAARRTRKEAPMMRLLTFDRGLDPDPAVKVALEFGHAEVPGWPPGPPRPPAAQPCGLPDSCHRLAPGDQAASGNRWATTPAGHRSPSRPVLPVTGGGPDGHGRSGSPGPPRAAPPVLLGQQVIGVGLDEQLHEHRVHNVPPGPAAASACAGRCCSVSAPGRPLRSAGPGPGAREVRCEPGRRLIGPARSCSEACGALALRSSSLRPPPATRAFESRTNSGLVTDLPTSTI